MKKIKLIIAVAVMMAMSLIMLTACPGTTHTVTWNTPQGVTLTATHGGEVITTGAEVEEGSNVIFRWDIPATYTMSILPYAGAAPITQTGPGTWTLSNIAANSNVEFTVTPPPPTTVAVNFTSAHGTPPAAIPLHSIGSAIQLVPIPNVGYLHFTGWQIQGRTTAPFAGNASVPWATAAQYVSAGALTFVAQWSDTTPTTVAINFTSVRGTPPSAIAAHNIGYDIQLTAMSNVGYFHFTGWQIQGRTTAPFAGDALVTWAAAAPYVNSWALTFVAQWNDTTPTTVAINFTTAHGTAPSVIPSHNIGYDIQLTAMSNVGYFHFTGWQIQGRTAAPFAGNALVPWATAAPYMNAWALTFVAQWNDTTPTDFTYLSAAITAAETHNEADYTAASWSNLQSYLTAAQSVYNNAAATQGEVNTATTNLENAISALVEVTAGYFANRLRTSLQTFAATSGMIAAEFRLTTVTTNGNSAYFEGFFTYAFSLRAGGTVAGEDFRVTVFLTEALANAETLAANEVRVDNVIIYGNAHALWFLENFIELGAPTRVAALSRPPAVLGFTVAPSAENSDLANAIRGHLLNDHGFAVWAANNWSFLNRGPVFSLDLALPGQWFEGIFSNITIRVFGCADWTEAAVQNGFANFGNALTHSVGNIAFGGDPRIVAILEAFLEYHINDYGAPLSRATRPTLDNDMFLDAVLLFYIFEHFDFPVRGTHFAHFTNAEYQDIFFSFFSNDLGAVSFYTGPTPVPLVFGSAPNQTTIRFGDGWANRVRPRDNIVVWGTNQTLIDEFLQLLDDVDSLMPLVQDILDLPEPGDIEDYDDATDAYVYVSAARAAFNALSPEFQNIVNLFLGFDADELLTELENLIDSILNPPAVEIEFIYEDGHKPTEGVFTFNGVEFSGMTLTIVGDIWTFYYDGTTVVLNTAVITTAIITELLDLFGFDYDDVDGITIEILLNRNIEITITYNVNQEAELLFDAPHAVAVNIVPGDLPTSGIFGVTTPQGFAMITVNGTVWRFDFDGRVEEINIAAITQSQLAVILELLGHNHEDTISIEVLMNNGAIQIIVVFYYNNTGPFTHDHYIFVRIVEDGIFAFSTFHAWGGAFEPPVNDWVLTSDANMNIIFGWGGVAAANQAAYGNTYRNSIVTISGNTIIWQSSAGLAGFVNSPRTTTFALTPYGDDYFEFIVPNAFLFSIIFGGPFTPGTRLLYRHTDSVLILIPSEAVFTTGAPVANPRYRVIFHRSEIPTDIKMEVGNFQVTDNAGTSFSAGTMNEMFNWLHTRLVTQFNAGNPQAVAMVTPFLAEAGGNASQAAWYAVVDRAFLLLGVAFVFEHENGVDIIRAYTWDDDEDEWELYDYFEFELVHQTSVLFDVVVDGVLPFGINLVWNARFQQLNFLHLFTPTLGFRMFAWDIPPQPSP